MVRDLAKVPGPVSKLFPRLVGPGDWRRYRLADEQVALYHEQGFLVGPRLLDPAQIAVLRRELEELADPGHPGHGLFYEFHSNESPDPSRVLFHALGAWRIAPAFHDLLWHPALVVPAAQLLGGAPRFWHDQLFCKPARHGGVVAWHQDYSYWTRTVPMAHLTCWIGLDDATRDNGCLQYVPGSHRWPLLPKPIIAGELEAIRAELPAELAAQFQPVAVELQAGECAFHHPLMLHGSGANSTDRPRRATVVNFFRDGTRADTDEPLLSGVPAARRGETLDGEFFPLLWDAREL